METITFDASGQLSVIVKDGRMKSSRLKWTADNLYIYLLGAVTPENRDTLNHLAITACQSRHISVFSLRTVQRRREPKKPAEILKDPFLRGLFDELIQGGYEDYSHECTMCGKPCIHVDEDGHCSTCRQVWNS